MICNLRASATLAHVIAGQCELTDVLIDAPGGFKLVPGASGLARFSNLDDHQQQRLLTLMAELETQCDVMLIDTGAGVGPDVMSFCHAAERVLVVTTPEPTSITDAYAVIKTMNAHEATSDIRLLVNMVQNEAEARSVFNRVASVCQTFLGLSPSFAGHILSDAQVPLAVRRRHPVVLDAPRGKAGICLLGLAHRIDRHTVSVSAKPGGLLHRMNFWKRT